jgi:transposase
MKGTTIAVDIAKNVFEIAVSKEPGVVHQHKRLSRVKFLSFFSNRDRATVVMEACGSAHHWGREVEKLGHRVVLLPPLAVHPYVVRNKTDRADAKGILEAYRNKDIKPVPVKSVSQHALGSLHRVRSQWLDSRTARLNMLRGLLRELGIFIPAGARKVVPRVLELVEDAESPLPDALRESFYQTCMEILEFERRIKQLEKQLEAMSRQIPVVCRLRTIPGIGLLTATALVAFIGDIQRFRSSRHFANFLGLTPKEHSSGNLRRLGRISKQGDVYIRMLLAHGGRCILWHSKKMNPPDRLRAWGIQIRARRGHNKAVIALANKLARIVWAVWKHGTKFQSYPQGA